MIIPLNPCAFGVPVCKMLWVCPLKAHQLKIQVSILSSLAQRFILQTPSTALANRGRHTASLHRDPRGLLINATRWVLPFTSEPKASHSRERRDPLAFPPVKAPPPRPAASPGPGTQQRGCASSEDTKAASSSAALAQEWTPDSKTSGLYTSVSSSGRGRPIIQFGRGTRPPEPPPVAPPPQCHHLGRRSSSYGRSK